jgi:hypothetical protein
LGLLIMAWGVGVGVGGAGVAVRVGVAVAVDVAVAVGVGVCVGVGVAAGRAVVVGVVRGEVAKPSEPGVGVTKRTTGVGLDGEEAFPPQAASKIFRIRSKIQGLTQ